MDRISSSILSNRCQRASKNVSFLTILLVVFMCTTGFSSKSFNSGVKSFNNGNYRSAISSFQKAVKKNPTEAIIHYNLGMAYFKQEQYSAALASLQAAMHLDDRFETLSRFYMGLCYYQIGKNEEARKELQWVSQICDNSSLGDAAKEVIKVL